MTPDERDRLAKVEQIVSGQQEQLKSIDDKLDQLMAIANMGKGVLWLALKVGGVIAVAIAALAWVWEKFHK